jgi:tetratricopeptide (TPR) repeat protein
MKGQLEKARDAIQQSLVIQPNRPEVLNNLGDVYRELGDQEKARKAFEKAVTLRPNYPLARFNLAKAYEIVNPKLAISEYETYLALVEGIPEEADRATRAKQWLKELTR